MTGHEQRGRFPAVTVDEAGARRIVVRLAAGDPVLLVPSSMTNAELGRRLQEHRLDGLYVALQKGAS